MSNHNYFCTDFQEGSCMITGISYNGSQDGTTVDADWSGVNNVNLLDFYLATGLQVCYSINKIYYAIAA